MDHVKRKALTRGLQTHVAAIAEDLQRQVLAPGLIQERARALHAQEKVGEDFAVWTDLLSRRAAVLWVLKTVYVRVLEDRGLVSPKRLGDSASWELFSHLAPNLGHSAYLRWVFKDLALESGGLPELFSPQPAEVAEPSDACSRELIGFWQATEEATDASPWKFDDEDFDGRLMGDLYQDLDPVVKARFALLQTPDFVLDFILDRTLTPAIEEFGIDKVRVLDPACGSGHFLLAALKRVYVGMRHKYPERPAVELVGNCLERIVGIDLNDYACALARARLVMTALRLTGSTDLRDAGQFHPKVFWADGLDQIELDEKGQADLFDVRKPNAVLTRGEVRERLRPELEKRFHVVVGNPPYITEKDPARREYHREKVGKRRRYVSAAGKYSLGAPFTERMFQVAMERGFVGEITANSFMKREFGKALIEKVLPKEDLFLVIDTSGAFIPEHGTPTVLLFGRRCKSDSNTVRVVMGKRGEPGLPHVPSQGKVWQSIVQGWKEAEFESEFVSVGQVPRGTLNVHPWSIGGGGAAELKTYLEESARGELKKIADSVGITSFTLEDAVYTRPSSAWIRAGASADALRTMVHGDELRDWAGIHSQSCIFPYDTSFRPVSENSPAVLLLWRYRTNLANNILFGGLSKVAGGLRWYEFGRLTHEKLKTPFSLTFAEVATHNHFVLDRGGKVFKQTAPVIKLPAGASEAEHLALLGQLNSSVTCFWLKQVCQCKGYSASADGARMTAEPWDDYYQFGGTKVQAFPVAAQHDSQLEIFAAAADRLARQRTDFSVRGVLYTNATTGPSMLRKLLDAWVQQDTEVLLQLVAIQEELDWYVYKLYGLAPDVRIRSPDVLAALSPGQRPFELTLAREDEEHRTALARGEEPDEVPTQWFARHGWEPVTSLDAVPAEHRPYIEERMRLTEGSRSLALIEQPTYKRRWYRPDYPTLIRTALEEFLCDALEDVAKDRKVPFTLKHAVTALQGDPRVSAVAELLAEGSLDLEAILGKFLFREAVPGVKHHVFKSSGLRKRAAWENTWELQHREDQGEKVDPPVPPKYRSDDFLKGEYWGHRGALDVPKERFIAFTEVPRVTNEELRYGWAGWTALERAQHLVALDTEAQDAGIPKDERIGLLYGIWFLLPYVAWESKEAADEFRSIVTAAAGPAGITEEMLERWAETHPPPTATRARRPRGRAA